MGVYGRAFRNVLYPLYESRLLRRKTLRYLDEYERTQWLDPEQTRARQLQKLRAMLVHCAEHVPYYRSLFDSAGISPDEIRTVHDLKKVPVTTKDDLRAAGTERVIGRGRYLEVHRPKDEWIERKASCRISYQERITHSFESHNGSPYRHRVPADRQALGPGSRVT